MIFELLGRDDVREILRLEQDSWVDGLQANAEAIEDRLEKGHVMIGAWSGGRLMGMTSFSYTWFDPENVQSLPRSFVGFSSQAVPETDNTA
jgi:hypothetical protein